MLQYAIEPTALAPVLCSMDDFHFFGPLAVCRADRWLSQVLSSATYNSCIFCMREVVENPLTSGTIFTSPPLFITSSAPTIWSMV